MPKPLLEKNFLKEAKPLMLEVFGTDTPNPYREPFTKKMTWKRILSPYNYIPDQELISVITEVSKKNNETGFYLSVYDRPKEKDQVQFYHWFINLSESTTYMDKIGFCNNVPTVLFSQKSTWGIISDIEGMAVLGATQSIGVDLEKLLPDPYISTVNFLKDQIWFRNIARKTNNQIDFTWVVPLLEFIYDKEFVNTCLADVNWISN